MKVDLNLLKKYFKNKWFIKKIYIKFFNGEIKKIYDPLINKKDDSIKLTDELSLINELKKAKKPLFFIYGNQVKNFDVPLNIKEYIFKNKIKTVFQSSHFMNSFVKNEKRWVLSSWVSCHSFTGRDDDDLMYGTCQDLSRRLMSEIELDNKNLNEIFKIMRETISLQVADFYLPILRSAVMLLEDCKKNNYDRVVICMSNMNIAIILKEILDINGFRSAILKPCNFPQKNFDATLALYKRKNITRFISLAKKNIDLKENLEILKDKIKKGDRFIFCTLKVNYNAYLYPITYLAEFMKNYMFLSIDRYSNEKVESENNELQLPDNFNFESLTPNTNFLEEKDSSLLIQNIIDGLVNKIEKRLIYQKFDLGIFFVKYGLNKIAIQVMASLYYYSLFDKLFKARKPDSILVSPSRSIEARAAILAGRKYGITSFDLQGGGAMFKTRRFWETEADYLLCSDALSKTIYHQLYNLKEEKVLLVGSPKLDYDISKYKKNDKQNSITKKIFLALQPLSEEVNLKMVNVCLKAISGIKNIELTVGFHPGDNETSKKNIINNANGKFNVIEKDSLKELMNHDICITYYSFMGIEAFAMGCKLIALNVLEHKEWPYRLSELGITKEAYTSKQLKKLILDNEDNILDESVEVLRDGLSLKRISRLIKNATTN